MKKLFALLLCLMMVLPMASLAEEKVDITLWTYPIGNWTNAETVDAIIANFNAVYPNISVTVQYLDYQSGDDQVTSAIEAGTTPDIIMEGPERLVTNWGAAGKMLDLSDLWTEEALADISATSEAVVAACKGVDGKYYEYPLCMTTHCMVIDRAAFEAADALQYLDEETRTWTTDGFVSALRALTEAGFNPTGIVYCGGQGGDQGTRALITNLGGGTYANAEHTEYTYASQENAEALAKLCAQDGISFDTAIVAADEIQAFVNGTFQMAFCWNIGQEVTNADALSFDVLPMAFPSDTTPSLQGGIWGFGVFDNGDEAKIEAAKTFIKFMTEDDAQYIKAVEATTYAPVRDVEGVYATDELFPEYNLLSPMMGDYYQVTKGWTQARTEWWNMLQRVSATDGSVEAILAEMETAQTAANAAAAAEG